MKQTLFNEFRRSLDDPEKMSALSKREATNEDWVFLGQRLIQSGVAPSSILGFARYLEKAGRGDCSLVMINILLMSYPHSPDVKAYQAKLLADFDPKAAAACCHELLKAKVSPNSETVSDIAYAADCAMELSLGSQEDYLAWIENTLKRDRSSKLLAQYAILLRRLQRYEESYAAATEAVSLETNNLLAHIAAALTASSVGNAERSRHFLRRAFDIDAHAAWWNMLVKYASYFGDILGLDAREESYRGKVEELATLIDAKMNECPNMIYLPHRFTPWHVSALKKKRTERISQGLPSAMLVTQGKSGSVSVGNILSSGFDLPCATYSLTSMRVIPSMLREYLRGGACYVTHLMPSQKNVDLLKTGGVKKIIVHVRDPRQILLSLVHHNQKYRKHAYGIRTRHATTDLSDVHRWIDNAINRFWLGIVNFQAGWFKASREIDITFTTFEQLITDRPAFLERILTAYGGDRKYFNKDAAFNEDVNTDRHLRKGQLDEWREVFTAGQIERVNGTIPQNLVDFFGWKL